jgi:hypothetical protein
VQVTEKARASQRDRKRESDREGKKKKESTLVCEKDESESGSMHN